MREGTASVRVSAVNGDPGGMLLNFAATRDTVNDRGRPLFALSTWSARITLPSGRAMGAARNGLRTIGGMVGEQREDGERPRGNRGARVQLVDARAPRARRHHCRRALTLGFVVRHLVRRGTIEAASSPFRRAALLLTGLMWLNEVCYQTYWFFIGGWSAASSLMLQMCGLSILFLPWAMLSEEPEEAPTSLRCPVLLGHRRRRTGLDRPGHRIERVSRLPLFLLLHLPRAHHHVFDGDGTRRRGEDHSEIAPACAHSHERSARPALRIDRLITLIPPYDPGNYFILGFPPPTGSVVDVFAGIFGPSPRYVVGLEIMGIVVFALLYVPWPIARWIRTRTHPRRAEGIAT